MSDGSARVQRGPLRFHDVQACVLDRGRWHFSVLPLMVCWSREETSECSRMEGDAGCHPSGNWVPMTEKWGLSGEVLEEVNANSIHRPCFARLSPLWPLFLFLVGVISNRKNDFQKSSSLFTCKYPLLTFSSVVLCVFARLYVSYLLSKR